MWVRLHDVITENFAMFTPSRWRPWLYQLRKNSFSAGEETKPVQCFMMFGLALISLSGSISDQQSWDLFGTFMMDQSRSIRGTSMNFRKHFYSQHLPINSRECLKIIALCATVFHLHRNSFLRCEISAQRLGHGSVLLQGRLRVEFQDLSDWNVKATGEWWWANENIEWCHPHSRSQLDGVKLFAPLSPRGKQFASRRCSDLIFFHVAISIAPASD